MLELLWRVGVVVEYRLMWSVGIVVEFRHC